MKNIVFMIAFGLFISGCSHKKVVVKNCEQASNGGVFVCDPL